MSNQSAIYTKSSIIFEKLPCYEILKKMESLKKNHEQIFQKNKARYFFDHYSQYILFKMSKIFDRLHVEWSILNPIAFQMHFQPSTERELHTIDSIKILERNSSR